MAATHTPFDSAAGHDSFVLLYRNVCGSNGTLNGYPGLDALNAFGHVLAHARRGLHGFAGGTSSVSRVNFAGTTPNVRFAAAQLAWIQGAAASSARQGLYWGRAEAALKLDGAEYAGQVSTLRQLISLPDSDQAPAQNAHYRHDIAAFDAFFGTAGLYS